MKERRFLILLMYVAVAIAFFDIIQTSKALMGVTDLQDALNLMQMKHLFMVSIVAVISDYAHSIPQLIGQLLSLFPIVLLILGFYWIFEIMPYLKKRYSFFILAIPIQYLLIGLFVGVSLASGDVKGSIQSVNLLGKITFITSIIGLLTSMIVIICYKSHLIDVESLIAYNRTKENSL